MAPVTFRCLCTCVREQLIQILTALLISEFAKSFCKLFSGDVGDLVCRKGAMLSCRSSGVWARGVWRYHRTRTLPLPPGTPRSGQLDLWHILQTASPHMLLPGKEIQKKKKKKRSVSPGCRDGNPALLLLALPWAAAEHPQVGNSPNSVTLGLFLPGKAQWAAHAVDIPHRRAAMQRS